MRRRGASAGTFTRSAARRCAHARAAAVDAAGWRAGSFLLVAGAAGSGKVSLLRALRTRSEGRAAFVVGACEALSVPVPLGPVRELFAATAATGVMSEGVDRF